MVTLPIAWARKVAALSEVCHSVEVSLIPMAVEVLDGWSEEGVDTPELLAGFKECLRIPPAECTQH